MEKKLENDFIKFWLENGILHSTFEKSTDMTLDKIKQLIELRTAISEREKQYWYYDITRLKNFPKEARDYADLHGQEYLYATAVLVNSHITKFIFNTFLKLKSANFPFQVFTSKEKAIEWLLELKQKNEKNL
ncbi:MULTISPECIES: DUF7793 family protein [unclassified Flavobacterium]|uniref:DUF7793 family protein n=1 Tax=unclassified Flavobacterium TaxID=196869 RepID=UPI003F8EDF5E